MEGLHSETFLAGLNRFAHAVWGNPQAFLRQLPQGVEFIDLSEYSDSLELLFGGILTNYEILVRDEYHTALQALQTKRYQRGGYVTGQPGIGKTYFLAYALVQFLGQRQPVVMQPLGGDPFYVLFGATATLHPIACTAPLHECGFVWALCDSNASVEIPAGAFLSIPSRVRIIQATSTKESRWKDWSKQLGAKCYILDIWTEEEIANLAILLKLNVERMTTLAKKWGTVPRTLLEYMDEQDWRIEDRYHDHCKIAVAECPEITGTDFPSPSPFFFLRPKKRNMGVIDREFYSMSVPTRTLRTLLAEALQGQIGYDSAF